ncbi:hypothetical protein P154DRAFT_430545 [Amniculicola lignicola CBS 123094]|uniref:Uncharacterized protein n=1 Tax=Amniculicola lignicola CBS 123094 TaxID=1392246 RepID=A0A6A5WMJ2_9PLEO|nr:hypothetical protein P154DRAFT_430545 [Amniculicola lignicola CBS 123094]
MGGRLSKPRAADGISKLSKPAPGFTRNRGIINGRTVMAPAAAFIMAGLLFVYTRTSIRAAKLNAQKHREADGGQISWHNESRRRHGQMDKVESDRSTFKEALMADADKLRGAKADVKKGDGKAAAARSSEEDQLRKMMGKHD